MMRNILLGLFSLLIGVFVAVSLPQGIYAQTVSLFPSVTQTQKNKNNQAQRIAMLHTRCDSEVNERIDSLNAILGKIAALKKVTDAQKAQFTSSVQSDITNLTTLKAKCDADTDLATLQADTLSIFTSYRIYAVFIPQLHLLAAIDRMSVTADILSQFATKLQARVQSVGNPNSLTTLVSDMQAKISDAQSLYSQTISQITSLTPQTYDANKTAGKDILFNARTSLKTAFQDLRNAYADAKQIRDGLKTFSHTKTPSASVTATQTPTP